MSNLTRAVFTNSEYCVAETPLWQFDYGQQLQILGIELPDVFEAHFSNDPTGESKTQIGQDGVVVIPDEYLLNSGYLYVWVYLHTSATDGETRYQVKIKVRERATPTDTEPTPQQQDVITKAIAALNEGVSRSETAAAAAKEAKDAWESMSAEAETLPAGSPATASYAGGVLSLGIPKGDKGDKGDKGEPGTGGASAWSEITDKPFDTIGENLKVVNGALTVDTAPNVQQDNTKPITSAAVYTEVGNINALLALI